MEKRVYDNEKLEKMLNRYIKEEKYGGFKPLLNEIFLRRAYEFQFDEKHMKKEIKNFVRETEKISFGKNIPKNPKKLCAMTRTAFEKGKYVKGRIYFNCDNDYMQNNYFSMIDLYEMLTHEVYHMISQKGEITALSNGKNGNPLNEIVNETAATRTTFLRNKTDDEKFREETLLYSETTFVANLLATSFGLEEREFLKGGLQNRKEFQKVCKKHISEQDYENDVASYCNKLEINLDILYNAVYVEEKNPNNPEIIASSLKQICYQIFNIANARIEKGTRKMDSEYAEELAYDFEKIRQIITCSLAQLENRNQITSKAMTEIMAQIYSSEAYLNFFNKVSDILILIDQKSQITDQTTWQQMEQLAKQGELINHAEEFGIEVNMYRYKIIEYSKKTNHEFDNPTEWDNDYVTKIMEQLWNEREVIDVAKLEEELASKTKMDKIKDFIAQFKNRNLKRLGTSGEQYKDLNNDLDERYKLSPENLKPVETGKNEHKRSANRERE